MTPPPELPQGELPQNEDAEMEQSGMQVLRSDAVLREQVEKLMYWAQLLEKADATHSSTMQRLDIQTVYDASLDFQQHVEASIDIIRYGQDAELLRRLRHDLRNILNLIIGFSYMLLRQESQLTLSPTQAEAARNLSQLGDALIQTVDYLR